MTFELHPRLTQDTIFIADLQLSKLLLMNDKRFPWLVLVPKKNDLVEIYDLPDQDQKILFSEITSISKMLKDRQQADKLNIACLGNVVPQLHVHIIARYKSDDAWPSPVWNFQKPIPYSQPESEAFVQQIKDSVSSMLTFPLS